MRFYRVPVQLEKEEKVFGGRISLRQFLYLVTGAGAGAAFFLAMYKDGMGRAAAAWVLCIAAGAGMAFTRIREVGVDRYILMLARFGVMRKAYPFRGGGKGW
ncbi:MAG: hypothetical protein HPY66_0998 [Firmicutes bacterium]|nr:hypothetical protein [Bacillota bacterium]